ncbi:hypothetical protein sync_1828 [Synechococcus sp. CC9311]|nr:hypothetical protein sync_1828 [Synechococcus sp. CC9311]
MIDSTTPTRKASAAFKTSFLATDSNRTGLTFQRNANALASSPGRNIQDRSRQPDSALASNNLGVDARNQLN